MREHSLKVAWFSYFPVEWLPDAPENVRRLPRMHPASWQRVLLNELEKIPGLHLHIIVLRKQFERDSTFVRNGVTFHLVKTPRSSRAPSFFWVDTILIRRKLAEIEPDIVHAWGSENGAALVASRLKYPYLVTVQGLLTSHKEMVPLGGYQRFAAFLEKWSLPRAPVLTTESNFAVEYIQRRWQHPNVQQIEHAPDWIFHRVARQPQLNPIRFLFIGGLSYPKGTDLLLSALDQLKNELSFELTLIGHGSAEFMKQIKAQASDALWKRIQFKHNLKPEEIAEELAVATMMIFPTRADTSPNSVKEAVVAGVPVVASAVGGIPDYVWPGHNGILFPGGNLEACVNAVRSACHHPLLGQGKVEPAALDKARAYLSPRRMGEGFLEVYRALASQNESRQINSTA